MSSILDSVTWGNSALSLLAQCKHLDPDKPSILQIRHSEWLLDRRFPNLTEKGQQAAIDFGTKLPINNSYRIYHTDSERTQQTAHQIHKGIISKENEAELVGVFNRPEGYARENVLRYIFRERELGIENPVRSSFLNWVGGKYPPDEFFPVKDFGVQIAKMALKNMESASQSTIDVYVTHENWVAAIMLSWLGMSPENWVSFLDGFLVQLYSEKMKVFSKQGIREVYYPYWWNLELK